MIADWCSIAWFHVSGEFAQRNQKTCWIQYSTVGGEFRNVKPPICTWYHRTITFQNSRQDGFTRSQRSPCIVLQNTQWSSVIDCRSKDGFVRHSSDTTPAHQYPTTTGATNYPWNWNYIRMSNRLCWGEGILTGICHDCFSFWLFGLLDYWLCTGKRWIRNGAKGNPKSSMWLTVPNNLPLCSASTMVSWTKQTLHPLGGIPMFLFMTESERFRHSKRPTTHWMTEVNEIHALLTTVLHFHPISNQFSQYLPSVPGWLLHAL
jgi:hypothetical protein